jgi:cation diffusion facilitator CzcD-associated flavoprotein CzcO
MKSTQPTNRVAVIGAGPGGIVVARYLLAHGYEPVLFEQSSRLGGQWNQGAPHSGVWPGMCTNTSSVVTCFSDLDWPAGTAMFPANQEVQAYLHRHAERFGVLERIRFQHRVSLLERDRDAWALTFSHPDGSSTERFSRAIVASGRYWLPQVPEIAGIETFDGSEGVKHAFYYRDAQQYQGKRVLVAGCAISAVEIAPEIAMAGAARVISCMRRQRYVLQRIVGGMPIDALVFNRYSALARERLPLDVIRANFKKLIERTSGTPEQWGGMPADDDPFVAGITQAQFYSPLVSERKIIVKPWIKSVAKQRVAFEDGSTEEVDAILLATGFKLELPFLSAAIHQTVGADGPALRLYRQTFHPQLPGLAFLGIIHQAGPYFPPLELQARWIAYTWAGLCRQPSAEEMSQEIATDEPSAAPLRMNEQCISFARAAGVEPDPEQWPLLKRALFFGPLAPVSFRLTGPDALPEAAERFAADAAEFGVVPSPELTTEQEAQLRTLQQAQAAAG